MDIFQVDKTEDKAINLNVRNYERHTRKTSPYYNSSSGEMKYYGICPACKNPIIIVNLYVDRTLDENKNKMPLHAKHIKYNVEGLADYIQENYDDCPLANPAKFGGTKKHSNKNRRNEIVALIKLFPVILYNEIRRITGIDFSENAFKNMINTFIQSEGYYYKYVTKYNIPYSFLNMQKSINLYNNKLYNTEFRGDMINAINESNHFSYRNFRIIPSEKSGYKEMKLYLTNHRIDSDTESEFIDIVIFEKYGDSENVVYSRTVQIDFERYINFVDKYRRVRLLTNHINISDDFFGNFI